MASLAEIRAKLKEQENRSSGNSNGPSGPNPIYPFWNMKEGDSATLRFLPDGDADNTFFWKERLVIKLPFAGIKGETDKYKFHVWKCMANHVQSYKKYVAGSKIHRLKIWVVSTGRSVLISSKVL
jgi:hypothetical protein